MEHKIIIDSPNFKNLKRSIYDSRVDSFLPNTLYLLNLRSNYSKKRLNNLNELKYDEIDNLSNETEVEKEPFPGEESTSNIDTCNNTSTYDEDNNTNNNNNNTNKKFNDVNYMKSHICFFGMEFYCLKYDLSNFTDDLYYSKESPEYNSYVLSNIFLRKDPELKLDQDALFDASWEVESVHLCKRILSFIKYSLSEHENQYNTNTNNTNNTDNDINNTNNNESNNTNNSDSNGNDNTLNLQNTLRNLRRMEDIRVLDGFCGIGGNLVHFASNFRYSLGVELNPNRVEMCKNNLKVYGVSDNCDVLNDSILNFCENYLKDPEHYFKNVLKRPELYREGETKQFDWVFLAFPWGGTNYKGTRDSEIYYLSECFKNFYKVVKLAGMIGHNVTFYLPRSQSMLELVKSAFLLDFNYILVDSYLLYPSYHKIRCCTVHFLNNSNSFNNNININNVIKFNNSKMFFNKLQLISENNSNKSNKDKKNKQVKEENNTDNSKENTNEDNNTDNNENNNTNNNEENNKSNQQETLNVININYYINKFNYLNFVNTGFLILLNEHNPNVYKKITSLLSLLPLNDVIRLANNSIELYYSSNRPTTITGNKRTLGGTFFYLLKLNYNNIYKIIEKKYKIVK